MAGLGPEQVQLLLRNKHLVVLGDSVQRTIYKDLVLFLQTENCLSAGQLRSKGEPSFKGDQLVEGGKLSNSTEYREVRLYHSPTHLLQFYFITRIYSDYVDRVLAGFQREPQPDILIVNSCVWDISRYGSNSIEQYRENLAKFFSRLREVILPECLVIWNMTMPLGEKIKGGFLIPELQYLEMSLRYDVIEANFYSALLADAHGFDVLDLHHQFRFALHHRAADGVHWSHVIHRQISQLLLEHIASAWGVALPPGKPQASVPVCRSQTWRIPSSNPAEVDFIADCLESNWGQPFPGYTSFHNVNPNDHLSIPAKSLPRLQDNWDQSAEQTRNSRVLRNNQLVMRHRPLHSRIPVPYNLPHYSGLH
ncbi:PC-esterase domain-containing protein 1A-like [Chiloscyllium punctatum]|uniref:PC-esterase domain-containing protein 1A-like n=1 Tax=Chiloscyllium punctatum TaxID=137246 RepID=UPI003B641C52